jgi:hypothetical protein
VTDTGQALPPAVYDQLSRIAAGAGREPTYAHPNCRCGKPYRPTCKICDAKPNKPVPPGQVGRAGRDRDGPAQPADVEGHPPGLPSPPRGPVVTPVLAASFLALLLSVVSLLVSLGVRRHVEQLWRDGDR